VEPDQPVLEVASRFPSAVAPGQKTVGGAVVITASRRFVWFIETTGGGVYVTAGSAGTGGELPLAGGEGVTDTGRRKLD
jgi:hypothetical protein